MIRPDLYQKLAVIILAAGSSSRLGKPKQLLQYQQQTLIKRVVKTALNLSVGKVIIVTGFLHQELVDELENLPIGFIQNPDWADGMGSSIRSGIKAIMEMENANQVDAALVLLSDQPLISLDYLQKLSDQFYSAKNSMIAATTYAGTIGVPAIFSFQLFPVLEQLSRQTGAKELFKTYREQLISVPFEDAMVDIDTEEDYIKLIQSSQDQKK